MVRPLTRIRTRAAPARPAAHAESVLIRGILGRTFPAGSELPAERELAARLGVTRPTLREALQRLSRDGWLSIQHGKPTRVLDVFREGGLNVLAGLVRHGRSLPDGFVARLLEVREALAPAYFRAAVEREPDAVTRALSERDGLGGTRDTPEAFAAFDWALHSALARASGNFVHVLILNGFSGFYEEMARSYFATGNAREASRTFYSRLEAAAARRDGPRAERLTKEMMRRSLELWAETEGAGG